MRLPFFGQRRLVGGALLGVCVLALVVTRLTGGAVAAGPLAARELCSPHAGAACDLWVQPASRARAAASAPPPGALTPAQLRSAYALPKVARRRQTVAVVIPSGAPTIVGDLQTFSRRFKLPSCRVDNGCLRIVNQRGAAGPLQGPNGDFPVEAALGLETVHGLCPGCRLLLVEADSTLDADLGAAADTAARLGANEMSLTSFSVESFNSPSFAGHYKHPGVVIVAASGDSGYSGDTPSFPASLPTVVAVGGTHLNRKRNGSYLGESAWAGTGSGCSSQFLAPRWQVSAAGSAGCGPHRALNDVAADADPDTGVAIYTATPVPSQNDARGWFQLGGTSLSTPIIAAVFALAGGTPRNVSPDATLYAHRNQLHDVTRGRNGSCGGRSICQAKRGYDGPTGLGTPDGVSAFIASKR